VGESDPHIHVDVDLHADVDVRHMLTATFGIVGNLPTRVSTGCGRQAPYAMTSTLPDKITCLACREHTHSETPQPTSCCATFTRRAS
jgi:hypothetical protein